MVLAKYPGSSEKKQEREKKGVWALPFYSPCTLALPSFSFLPHYQCELSFRNKPALILFASYVKVLDYCWFKWRFTIHQNTLICTKSPKSTISILSVVGEGHIVQDVQFKSSTVWSSNPIQLLSSIHLNQNSSKHNCKRKKILAV